MWAIDNRTPYKVGKTWNRDRDGNHEWIVGVKATYDIVPNAGVVLAEHQSEPLRVPEYNGEPGESSLRYDADLVASKPTTDVVLNGTAYAPRGRPTTDFTVAMGIGAVRKVLRVRGNRVWNGRALGGGPSAPEPVTEVPITYERAYGGYDHVDSDPQNHRMDPRNPVGCGVVAPTSTRAGLALPNFEYPSGSLDTDGPAGFGAIDSFWSPRRELTGTYDAAWKQDRRPLLPVDWDSRCLLCSPIDQRPDVFLRGGEVVELVNLTPEGLLRFALPKVHLTFNTHIDGRNEEHRARLSTVVVEPDYLRVMMVWLTALACRNDADYLEETVVREKRMVR